MNFDDYLRTLEALGTAARACEDPAHRYQIEQSLVQVTVLFVSAHFTVRTETRLEAAK